MADLEKQFQIPKGQRGIRTFRGKILPAWARRADENPHIHTKDNESVRSASGEHKGKELLFPTIRMRGPGLEKLVKDKDDKKGFARAIKEALDRQDYIEFDNPQAATKWSKAFSDKVGSLP